MRILYITDGLGGGGKERQIVEIAAGLTAGGFVPAENLLVLCLNREAFYGRSLERLGVRIESLLRGSKTGLGRAVGLARVSRSFRPDIVHSFSVIGTFFSLWPRFRNSFRLIDGSIRSAPAPASLPFKIRALNRLNYRFADAIVANSLAGLDSFRPPPLKSMVIHNGFNFGRVAQLAPKEKLKKDLGIKSRLVIGMVANFFPSKDYDTFLQAAQNLLEQRDDLVFVAVGCGDLMVRSQMSIQHRHRDGIRFLGQREDVESLVNMFDIAVLTTRGEGISNSIMEYMALGKPVIATDCAGNREIIEDGVSGFLVRPADAEGLAAKVSLLLQDEGQRNRMGRTGASRIREEFSLDRMISAYCRLYAKLASQASGGKDIAAGKPPDLTA